MTDSLLWTGLLVGAMAGGLLLWPVYATRNLLRLLRHEGLFRLGLGMLVLDQASKWSSVFWLKGRASVPVIPHFFSLTYVENTGAAFGLFRGQTHVFVAMAILTIFIILFYLSLAEEEEKLIRLALILILAGAIGNLIDRIALGYVIDFLDLHYGAIHWPVFNVADTIIDVGVGLIVIDVIRDFWTPEPA